MAYFIDLFSPETFEAFSRSPRDISGFAPRLESKAARVKIGDVLVCYVTKLSRWCGLLEVESLPFADSRPIFVQGNDPYTLRFRVRQIAWLELESALPIHHPSIWEHLSFTRGGGGGWTGKLRTSLTQLSEADGAFLEERIRSQAHAPRLFDFSDDDRKKLRTNLVARTDGVVAVTVPESSDEPPLPQPETRESLRLQALLARIGKQMGFQVWLPRNDRGGIERELRQEMPPVLERLPLNYDDATLRTIEQIDVLWLKGRSIVRAFEVEHTTSIYSGLLRMGDLLALQPNMDIKLHIVAPEDRRDTVFREIKRPIFSLIEGRPLASCCTYLSYDSLRDLAAIPHLSHMSDSVLEEYAEEAE